MKYSCIKDFAEAMQNKQLPLSAVVGVDKDSVYIYEYDFNPMSTESPPVLYREETSPEYFLINLLQEFGIEEAS